MRMPRRGSAAGLAALLTVVAIAAATPLWGRLGAPPPAVLAPGDTVVVWGAHRFTTPTGSATLGVESFTLSPQPLRQYLVKLANGNADGTSRASTASVVLNGQPVISAADLGSAHTGTRVIQALASDTVKVTVEGSAGAFVDVSVLEVVDPTFAVFGPQTFVRATGQPETETVQFSIDPARAGSPAYLCVVNGLPDGTKRTSSARFWLNGTEIVFPTQFNQQVGGFTVPVTLQTNNTLEVRVASVPASQVTVCVQATDVGAPVLTIATPAPDAITADSAISVTGTVVDETPTTVTVNGVVADRSGTSYSASVPLVEGPNTILVHAVDAAGNVTDSTRTVTRDSQDPELTVTAPADQTVTNQPTVTVTGTVSDATNVTVNVNGTPAPVENGAFSAQVSLTEGTNFITVTATDQAGNASSEARQVTLDTADPVIAIAAPAEGLFTNAATVAVTGTVTDATAVTLTVNGAPVTPAPDGSFSATVELTEGANTITVVATDAGSNSTSASRAVTRDTEAPVLSLAAPDNGFATAHDTIHVRGSVTDATPVIVSANGIPQPVDGAGEFTGVVSLAAGSNTITVIATDAAGNTTTLIREGISDVDAPVITSTGPANGSTTSQQSATVSGSVQDATTVTVTVNGVEVPLSGTEFSTSVALQVGVNTITIVATDAVGNSATATLSVTRTQADPQLVEALPIDNTISAPAIKPGVATNVSSSAAFLYSGPNPVQTGVQAGAIEPLHVAVIRGRAITRDGTPLAGVTVRVTDQPKYGETQTRANGLFDMAVNGFGPVHVTYSKAGYLPIARVINAAPLDYASAADVVMTVLDTAVTTIAFTQPIEVARASVQSDADGARQATLLFQQGTGVTMTMPDGSTVPLSGPINVRATEYTVGPNGEKAMPAQLPPSSGYTYAVELSVDEALAAGATKVTFNKVVYGYLENFLGLPVGFTVPNGYYDATKRAWLAEENGRVIRVLSIENGAAVLDVIGDSVPSPADTLTALGVTTEELQTIAQTYSAGQTLWRVPVTHFSPRDWNLAFICAFGNFDFCKAPSITFNWKTNSSDPTNKTDSDQTKKEDKPCGSVILCQRQALGEMLPVAGTPYQLYYQSNRAPGYRAAYTLTIPVTTDSVPAGVEEVRLEVSVAGRKFERTFTPAAGQRYLFQWDGLDAYGRQVLGRQPVTVRVGFAYTRNYMNATAARAFGLPGETPSTVLGRALFVSWTEYTDHIGQFDTRTLGLGGWTLADHHVYDATASRLLRGDGDVQSAETVASTIRTIAGKANVTAYAGDGGPAVNATFSEFGASIAVGPDGGVYLGVNNRIRRIGTDGIIRRIAGTGNAGNSGDGGNPLTALLTATYMTFLPDGSLVFYNGATLFPKTIRRIGADSIVRLVAGGGQSQADGVPATQALFGNVRDMDAGPDGSIYVAEGFSHRIRRITPAGLIETVAGNGTCSPSAPRVDGVATQMGLCVQLVAVGPDGSLYVSDLGNLSRPLIRRVTPDGRMTTIAGNPAVFGSSPNGTRALDAGLGSLRALAVGSDNTVYFMDAENRIRAVTPDGYLRPVAGDASGTISPVDGALAATDFTNVDERDLKVAADGSVLALDATSRLRRIGSAFPGLSVTDFIVPSEDASEVYVFSSDGRHLRTVDATTGVPLLSFQYDTLGRLTGVLDRDSLLTSVEHDAQGRPTGIVAPFGQRTVLTTDGDGFIATAKAPATAAYSMTYGANGALGLLSEFRDPATGLHSFTYDSLGRLESNTNETGTQTLTRTEGNRRYAITHTDGAGVAKTHHVIGLLSGGSRQITEHPGSRPDTSTFQPTGNESHVPPDGTRISVQAKPDPRFGGASTYTSRLGVTVPNHPTLVITSARAVVPGSGNPSGFAQLIDSVLVGSGSSSQLFVTSFDANARVLESRSAEGRRDSTFFDAAGRPVRSVSPGIAVRDVHYDPFGRVRETTFGGRTTRLTYNAAGFVDTIVDPLLRRTRFLYDSAGRTTSIVRTDGRTIALSYDSAGRLALLTPPGKPAHRFAYNAAGLLEAYTPPQLPGGISTPTAYAYDAAERLRVIRRPTGDSVSFAYDSAGRPRTVSFADATVTTTYNGTTGRPSTVSTTSDGGSTVGLTFAGPLLTRVSQSGADVTGAVDFTYDAQLRVSTNRVGPLTANQVTFGYDRDNLLTQAGALTLSRAPATGFVTGTTLGSVVTAVTYDSLGGVASETARFGTDTLYGYTLVRDDLQRIVAKTERTQGTVTQWGFAYDSAGRLAEVVKDGVVSASYAYDDNGNRLAQVTPLGTESGIYDGQDRLVTYNGAEYRYSLAGELTHKIDGPDTTALHYDAMGALKWVELPDGTRIDYVIDALGRRVGRKVDGAFTHRFVYESNLRIAAEVSATGAVTTRYIYGTQVNVPEYMIRGGVTYRFVTDHLGSVRLVVRLSDGVVMQRVDYDEFGRVAINSAPGFQPFGFAGGLQDDATHLVRFGGRDYDPEFGRFVTKDPIGLLGGINVYAYARFDPVNYRDPTGLQPCEQAKGASGQDPDEQSPDSQADGHKDPPERIICSEVPVHPACAPIDEPGLEPAIGPVEAVVAVASGAWAVATIRIAAARGAVAVASSTAGGRFVIGAIEGGMAALPPGPSYLPFSSDPWARAGQVFGGGTVTVLKKFGPFPLP